MDALPNRIREYRKAKGWSLEHLADQVGVSYAHVSEVERGKIDVSHSYLRRYAAALGVKPGDLLIPEENEGSLSPEELAWVARYRAADPATRVRLEAMADLVAPAPVAETERKRA